MRGVPHSPDDRLVAEALYASGAYSASDIARLLCIPITTISQWLHPNPEARAATIERLRGTCANCGAPNSGARSGRGRREAHFCVPCGKRLVRAIQGAKKRQRQRRLEELWASGLPTKEIARILGRSSVNISSERARGANLPYRYSADRVEAAKRNATVNLAKARAAKGIGREHAAGTGRFPSRSVCSTPEALFGGRDTEPRGPQTSIQGEDI